MADKLDAVAAAAKNVSQVSDTYKQKLAKTPSADKERVTNEANAAITKAVTDQGLSVDEYVSIMKVAQNDPAVRDRFWSSARARLGKVYRLSQGDIDEIENALAIKVPRPVPQQAAE